MYLVSSASDLEAPMILEPAVASGPRCGHGVLDVSRTVADEQPVRDGCTLPAALQAGAFPEALQPYIERETNSAGAERFDDVSYSSLVLPIEFDSCDEACPPSEAASSASPRLRSWSR